MRATKETLLEEQKKHAGIGEGKKKGAHSEDKGENRGDKCNTIGKEPTEEV